MSSRDKNKKKRKREPSPTVQSTTPTPQSSPIPSLPYDLLLICVARVSRLYYPTLSLVSKSFRSLISSPELYKVRSLLGLTESCLYVCLRRIGDKSIWFTLCRKPDKTLTKTLTNETRSRSGYALATVPIPKSPRARFNSLVAVGSKIYNIVLGNSLFTYSRVSILDCTSHTWSEAPSLRVKLCSISASVLDEKIYVAGSYIDDDSSLKNSFEVLDTKTQIWDSVPSEIEDRFDYETASIDGKFLVVTNKAVVAYDSKEGKWDMVGERMGRYMVSPAYCVIGNVLYSASNGVFKWYDSEVRMWRDLQGLVGVAGLPKISRDNRGIRLGDYGGKMVLLWDELVWPGYYKKIWCAEIALERRNSREIWGKVEWFDHLLQIRSGDVVVKVLAITA